MGNSDCEDDYVSIYDQEISHDVEVARYCGDKKPVTVKTYGNIMTVKLVSKNSDSGFSATFTEAECGGFATGADGTVHSENFPDNYPGIENLCTTFIRGPKYHS